jgi:hypothetical protein
VDLSLVSAKRASKWLRQPPTPSEIEATASQALAALRARLPGPFDVVASACVLTQLGFALTQALRDTHPSLGALRLATVRLHLQTLLELTALGGTALLVSDLASSTHYPLQALPGDAELRDVLADVLAKRAFYHVAEPQLIADLLAAEAPESRVSQLPPWLWSGPQARTYLVCGYAVARPA